jgi:hypothetical protein
MSKPRELTVEEARVMLDEHPVDWTIGQHYPHDRMIEIMTDEFGLIEVSEAEYYKNYSRVR